jgi:hypothetical protein
MFDALGMNFCGAVHKSYISFKMYNDLVESRSIHPAHTPTLCTIETDNDGTIYTAQDMFDALGMNFCVQVSPYTLTTEIWKKYTLTSPRTLTHFPALVKQQHTSRPSRITSIKSALLPPNTTKRRTPEGQHETFQAEDYVLVQTGEKTDKLQSKFQGPFRVISHEGNNVTVEHVAQRSKRVVETPTVKRFIGTDEQAFQAALHDEDQYKVTSISHYRGEPSHRSTMEYLVHFEDGSQVWRRHEPDIISTEAFQEFVYREDLLQLIVLRHNADYSKKWLKDIDREKINPSLANSSLFIDLRSWGLYYNSLSLPYLHTTIYMVPARFGAINKTRIRRTSSYKYTIDLHVPLFDEKYIGRHGMTPSFIKMWYHSSPPTGSVVIDEQFTQQYPDILRHPK